MLVEVEKIRGWISEKAVRQLPRPRHGIRHGPWLVVPPEPDGKLLLRDEPQEPGPLLQVRQGIDEVELLHKAAGKDDAQHPPEGLEPRRGVADQYRPQQLGVYVVRELHRRAVSPADFFVHVEHAHPVEVDKPNVLGQEAGGPRDVVGPLEGPLRYVDEGRSPGRLGNVVHQTVLVVTGVPAEQEDVPSVALGKAPVECVVGRALGHGLHFGNSFDVLIARRKRPDVLLVEAMLFAELERVAGRL
mmetsp:Transcript_5084/g.11467  ORF Transcript_5084/g.11467 Transcript_5084/m.11467 type:complete len:245 (+) Transcript_5084:76-810(+)